MNKIDNEGNQQTRQYSKEVQPENNSSNTNTINIYNDGTKKTRYKPHNHKTQTQEKV